MTAPITLAPLDTATVAELHRRYEDPPNVESRTRYQMLLLYGGNLCLLSFSSSAARYCSGDLRKRYCMRRASWQWFNSLRKVRQRVKSVGHSSGPENEYRREATEATTRTAPRMTIPGAACLRPVARRS